MPKPPKPPSAHSHPRGDKSDQEQEAEHVTPESYQMTHWVGPHQHGIRLDHFLKERYVKRSRGQLQRAIEAGCIFLLRNQSPHLQAGVLKASSQLVPGDEIRVVSERRPEPAVDFNYQILHEDEALLVVNKPAGLPVHPAGRYFFHTLLSHLQASKTAQTGQKTQYFLAHRLDKETSGVLILTKTKQACTALAQQFFHRTTLKRYLAITRGITPEQFQVSLAIEKALGSLIALKMQVTRLPKQGQNARTEFYRQAVFAHSTDHGPLSLVECIPHTGRQHQIRVHLASAGFPILGDKLYGLPEAQALQYYAKNLELSRSEITRQLGLPRHALHAAAIRFLHPLTQIATEFEAPLPSDLADFIQQQQQLTQKTVLSDGLSDRLSRRLDSALGPVLGKPPDEQANDQGSVLPEVARLDLPPRRWGVCAEVGF